MSTVPPNSNGAGQRSQPESFRGRALAASLTVNDLQKSIAWYRDVAGFTVAELHEWDGEVRGARLVAGSVTLMLGQDDGAKGWDRVKGDGMSFYITTAQDIDTVAQRIRDAGGVLETEPADMPWGVRAFRVADPDGFKISISSEPV